MEFATLLSLGLYFALMLAIGLWSFKTSSSNISGYMLGGRQMSPAVTALSAGASDMSGWMLMGLPGAMYLSGLSAAWIAFGLIIGAYVNYLVVAPRLRHYTEHAGDAITIPDFLEKRFGDNGHSLRILASVVIIIFFTLYTSSGMVAGGKLFESAFGLDYHYGLLITTSVVVAYTLFGGFKAVSTTDFVQGCIMFVALILVPLSAFSAIGGIEAGMAQIETFDSSKLSLFEGISAIGIVSAMAWGLGYFGQPHIIVRFMAIKDVASLTPARRIGMTWMLVTLTGALATGLAGIAYVQSTDMVLKDAETIFIVFSTLLFNPLVTGFLLAAILAAIMSTISSQLLVSSSSLTEDCYRAFINKRVSQRRLVNIGRLSVLLVSLVAIALAWDQNNSILSLVSNAWAGFGAAFGPVIILSLYWQGLTRAGALAGMLVGALVVLGWIYLPIEIDGQALSSWMYEIVPGFILATLAAVWVSKLSAVDPDIAKRHQQLFPR